MLAVGRALMAKPKLVMMDEPSLGLAPLVVKGIFEIIKEINKQGITVLLIEQNANMALKTADWSPRHADRHDPHAGRGQGASRKRGGQGCVPWQGKVTFGQNSRRTACGVFLPWTEIVSIATSGAWISNII